MSLHIAFVAWPDVPKWLALGWHYAGPLPGSHGHWSACMEWRCDCPMKEPRDA
jgi:hypothetical protein